MNAHEISTFWNAAWLVAAGTMLFVGARAWLAALRRRRNSRIVSNNGAPTRP